MWERFKVRWASRPRRPTPAWQILPVITRVVTLPVLSALVGREIRVRVGIASEAELSAMWGHCAAETTEADSPGRPKKLSVDQIARANREADAAIEAFLRARVIDPPLAPADGGFRPGAIPYQAVELDRFFLLKEIAVLSGVWRFRRDAISALQRGTAQIIVNGMDDNTVEQLITRIRSLAELRGIPILPQKRFVEVLG